MRTVMVKTSAEMNRENLLFNRQVKDAQVKTITKLGQVNYEHSGQMLNLLEWSGGGTLLSQLTTKPMGQLLVRVIADSPYGYEIEEGLKTPEFRLFTQYPKLRAWVEDKWLNIKTLPEKGIWVGRSGRGHGPTMMDVPHPKGLHFMREGFKLAADNAEQVLSTYLRMIN